MMNLMSQHIPFAQLAELAEGRLLPEERERVRAHLDACQQCSGQLATLDQVINLMRTDMSEDAPRDAQAYAVGLFRARAARRQPSPVERVLAALSFDSLRAAPAFGVRSGQAAARQLLYSAGEHDLDLRIVQSGDKWVVSGQVLGQCAGGRVELEGAGKTATAELNDQCEFALSPVPGGSYTLHLRLADAEIEVPEIILG
jgi:anti-sigma factor RsiW